MNSVSINKFNNFYKNADDACHTAYLILNRLFPFIKEHGKEILSGYYQASHCHVISENKQTSLACKVIHELHKLDIDPEVKLWQVGLTEGIRVVFGINGGDENNIFYYPLFIDNHHCLYPNDHYRNDYKICKYSFSDSKGVKF